MLITSIVKTKENLDKSEKMLSVKKAFNKKYLSLMKKLASKMGYDYNEISTPTAVDYKFSYFLSNDLKSRKLQGKIKQENCPEYIKINRHNNNCFEDASVLLACMTDIDTQSDILELNTEEITSLFSLVGKSLDNSFGDYDLYDFQGTVCYVDLNNCVSIFDDFSFDGKDIKLSHLLLIDNNIKTPYVLIEITDENGKTSEALWHGGKSLDLITEDDSLKFESPILVKSILLPLEIEKKLINESIEFIAKNNEPITIDSNGFISKYTKNNDIFFIGFVSYLKNRLNRMSENE